MVMQIWKHLIALISLILGLSAWGYAESSDSQSPTEGLLGQGYVFFASGGIIGDWNSISTVHFGGRVNYWFRKRMGLRLEFRDHMDMHNDHYLSGRIGFSFR
jgi:hypothetical protein